MGGDFDINCPACGASMKGENMLRHMRKQHNLVGNALNKEYAKVKHLVRRQPRDAKVRRVQCISCNAELLEVNLPRHISGKHKHESVEEKHFIKTQSILNPVVRSANEQAIDALPQELLEPEVPPALPKLDNVDVSRVDCPLCTVRVIDVRSHLKIVHGKRADQIRSIISNEQNRRSRLQLTYKTSQVMDTLGQLPQNPNELYTGKGLVSIYTVVNFLRGAGFHIEQDCLAPQVWTHILSQGTPAPVDMVAFRPSSSYDVRLVAKLLESLPKTGDPQPSTSAGLERPPPASGVLDDLQSSDTDDGDPQPPTSGGLDDPQPATGDDVGQESSTPRVAVKREADSTYKDVLGSPPRKHRLVYRGTNIGFFEFP